MLQTTASALETALNRKYYHTRLPTCQYLLPLEWWFHICSSCILSTLPRLSLSGDWCVSRMQNESGEYTDHLILWNPPPQLLTGWLVIFRLVGLFVAVNSKQCSLTTDYQAVNLGGWNWPLGGLGGGPQRIGRRAWTSDQERQTNIRGALLGERFDSDQWRGVKGSWDSSEWGTGRVEDTMPPLIGFSLWNIHCSLFLGDPLCSESHNWEPSKAYWI